MNKPDASLSALLERLESEWEIADGRTVRLCRDAHGGYWVIDGAERIVPLAEFADDYHARSRSLIARERAAAMREIANGVQAAFARVVARVQQAVGARTARA
jgi:hypothetical protein